MTGSRLSVASNGKDLATITASIFPSGLAHWMSRLCVAWRPRATVPKATRSVGKMSSVRLTADTVSVQLSAGLGPNPTRTVCVWAEELAGVERDIDGRALTRLEDVLASLGLHATATGAESGDLQWRGIGVGEGKAVYELSAEVHGAEILAETGRE